MNYIRPILPSIVPGTIVAVLFLVLLGYRRDYLGHYAAGFGGTLTALSLAIAAIAPDAFSRRSAATILLTVVLCIAAGGFAEATLYNIAKFDEVDFCNQSLGAALAGMGFQLNVGAAKPEDSILRSICYAGLIALHIGIYFAIF